MSPSQLASQYVPPSIIPFFFLSHPSDVQPRPSNSSFWTYHYVAGPKDILFVAGWSIICILLRLVLLRTFKTFALWWLLSCDNFKRKRSFSKENGEKRQLIKDAEGLSSSFATANGNGSANGVRSRPSSSSSSRSSSQNGIIPSNHSSRTRTIPHKTTRAATRFAEQGFAFVYYTVMWTFGLWVNRYVYTESFMDLTLFWDTYPHTPSPGPVKFYYLIAFSFYLTQMFILNIEEHRSDHYQMLGHHIVTVFLIGMSWWLGWTKFGCTILLLLDWCDIFLPLAKMTKYLSIPLAPDVLFVIFLTSWFVTRQVLLLIVIWSVTFEGPARMDFVWDPSTGRVATRKMLAFVQVSLWILYGLLCVWFWMGCKVAYNVVMGKGAEEPRSDGEDDCEDGESSARTSD